jgi:uncharacterized protein
MLLKKQFIALLFMFAMGFGFAQSGETEIAFDEAVVIINGEAFAVEYAHTNEQRAQGLMFRKSLCENCGMLFEFKPTRRAGMWMKNTFIPLDVAFIDDEGVITDIKKMQPHDLTSVNSSQKIAYALEMNQGWFANHAVKEGDKIRVDFP